MKNVKESYKNLQSKLNLPTYEELDKEFELLYTHEIFEIARPLVFVRRRMYDRIGNVCGMIQGILQPNPGSPISLEESSFFSKEEKQKEFINLLKDLMYYERKASELDLDSTDEQEAKFIKELFSKWKEVKPQLKKIASKLSEGWKKEPEEKKDHSYLG